MCSSSKMFSLALMTLGEHLTSYRYADVYVTSLRYLQQIRYVYIHIFQQTIREIFSKKSFLPPQVNSKRLSVETVGNLHNLKVA